MKKDSNIQNFKTPEGYFENFEERLFGKIAEGKFPKSAGFAVPENYFGSLEEKILLNAKTPKKATKVIPLFLSKNWSYAAAIAACLVVAFIIFKNKGAANQDFNSLQLATIDDYINDGNLNMDIYDVTNFINDEDISAVDINKQGFSANALENYLLENIDEETLLKEE